MAATDFPAEFLSLEADFVDSKMAINNSISDILRGGGGRSTARLCSGARGLVVIIDTATLC